MNFQQLRYALAVHQHKHFGQAAKSCHITQATLSAMLKKLEEELGYALFDRSQQPIITTEEGQQFMGLARQILAAQQEMLGLLDQSPNTLSGALRIGIIPTIANSLLPIILPPLLSDNPDLHLDITEITTEEIQQQLKMGKIDLGILATPLEDEDIHETILYYEAMMVYGAMGEGKEFITSKDIKDNTIWLLEEGHCFREQTMTICNIKEKENTSSNLAFAGSSFDTLLNLTDRFGGYTLVPELYYDEMPQARKQKTKPFQKPIPVREISLVSYRPQSRQRTLSFLAQAIQRWVKPHLSTTQLANKDMEVIGI